MPTPEETIGWLSQAGLGPAEIMQAVYYLRHGEAPPGADLSPKAQQAISYLGAAGLDSGGVTRADQYLTAASGGAAPGAGPTASGIPKSLGEDPAHLAFLRAVGLDSTDATNNQLRIDALNRRAGLDLESLKTQGAQQQENIAGGFEARGLYRSGERLRSQARQQEGQAQQEGQITGNAADQTAALVAELAQRRADRQGSQAEQGYGTASSLVSSQGY